jgi:tripartite-type tricarboxylate transporter receptor subunit TctC
LPVVVKYATSMHSNNNQRQRETIMELFTRIAASLALAFGLITTAQAQANYPDKPVRVIVGFGSGAATDVTARVVAKKLGDILGQQFVVENKPGFGGNIGTGYVVKAPADGYTLLFGTVASTVHATLSPNLGFDFAKDLVPITIIGAVPNILVVHPSLGVKDLDGLIKLLKSQPGKIQYASSGVGTSPHLSAELFKDMAGVDMVHVPYKGSAQGVIDVIAGRVPVMFAPASTALPHITSGKLVAIATTQTKRAGIAPDLPTVSEAGLKGFDTGIWFGLMAPTGTPQPIIAKLSKAANEALKSPDVIEPLKKQGIDVVGGSQDEFAKYIQSEIAKWARVIKSAGIPINQKK